MTPYDRPPPSARGVRAPPLETEDRSWLGKLVDPASQFIYKGASRLLSSVFGNRPPAPPIQGFPVLGRRPESFFLDLYLGGSFLVWLVSGIVFSDIVLGFCFPSVCIFDLFTIFSDRFVRLWLGFGNL